MDNCTGIILAGGKSSRMGKEKGLLKINNTTYCEMLIETLQQVFKKLLIVANSDNYKQFGLPVIKDIHQDKGPLSGLHTGLKNCQTEYGFFFPVDSPFITANFIKKMLDQIKSNSIEAIIPNYNQRIYPLTAIYKKSCVDGFELALDQNRLKVKMEIENLNHKILNFGANYSRDFININTPEDLINLSETI